MPPLLVALVDPPHLSRSGDWYYRSDSPGRALAALPDVHVVNFDGLHPARDELVAAADVVVLTNICDADLLPLIAARKARGQVTVYEINDDVSAVQPWNAAYDFYRQRESFSLFLRLAHECDALQVSVRELARLYGYLNRRTVVFPNQLEHVPSLSPRTEATFTVGWGGSHGHLHDVARIAQPLGAFIAETPGAELRIMGADTIWQLFEHVPADKKRYTPPGPIDDYYAFVQTLDVGIAPLEDTAFNRCRSDVKLLEYAAHGAVAVVQRAPAYASVMSAGPGETGFTFDSADELVATLRLLHADRTLRHDVARRAHAYVSTQRSEARHASERLALYVELLGSRERGALPSLATLSGARVAGRHVELRATRFEELLHDGIAQRSDPERAAQRFAEAALLQPASYLPALFTGSVKGEVAAYEAALRMQPSSPRATLGLAMAEARASNLSLALTRLAALGEALPGYDAPFLRAAQLLDGVGAKADADMFRAHAAALVAPLWPAWKE